MSSRTPPTLRSRFGGLALAAVMTAGPVGCDGAGGGGGKSPETIPTGEGQAVIPKQELQNLGTTEKSLAPAAKKAR